MYGRYGPSLTWQGLPCTASTWAPAPRHHCPLPALPVGPVSFPELPLHYGEKAAEVCSVLLSRAGVPGFTSLLPDHLRGPGCPGTLWLVVQQSIFWQTSCISSRFQSQLSCECLHCSLLCFPICFGFFLEVIQQQESNFFGSDMVVPDQSYSKRRGFLTESSHAWLLATLRGLWDLISVPLHPERSAWEGQPLHPWCSECLTVPNAP